MARYFVWADDPSGTVYRMDQNGVVWYKSHRGCNCDWRVSGFGEDLLGDDEEDLASGEMIEINQNEV